MSIIESETSVHEYSAEALWNAMVTLDEPVQVGNLTIMPEYAEWDDVLDEYGVTRGQVGQETLVGLEENISRKKLGTQLSFFIVYQTNEETNVNIVYTDKKIASTCRGLDSRFGFQSIYSRAMPKAFYDLVWNKVCMRIDKNNL